MNGLGRCGSAAVIGGVVAALAFAGAARGDEVAQPLPFSQDWTNTGLIGADDDWSGVPGVIGRRGDELAVGNDVDPQLVVAGGEATPVDVNANETSPNTLTAGGLSEFAIPDPVVALQPSGAADAPHLVLHLDTTGSSGILVGYRLRDIDGSADNAQQQVALQYRIGGSGDYTNLPEGYVADATDGPNIATRTTEVTALLPPDADNQPLVQVRVLSTNATLNDEHVGIDDLSVRDVPELSIANRTVTEGNDGAVNARFRVTLSPPSATPVSVDYATVDGSAVAPPDYGAGSGTLNFAPGQTVKRIDVPVNGDLEREPTEAYSVGLSNAPAAVIADGTGAGRILNDDLIRNHGAEDDAGSPDGFDDIDLSDWAESGATTAVVYGAPGGFPTLADGAAIGGGDNFFAGGLGMADSNATQNVAVPASWFDEVDAGTATATLRAHLGGFEDQADNARVIATFLDAGGTELGSIAVGPVTAADRGNLTSLLLRSDTEDVPPGTRRVRVRQIFRWFGGGYSDGYSDNLSLTLGGA